MTKNLVISKENIVKLLNDWSQQYTVLVPSREGGVAAFAKWDGSDTSFLDWYRNTVQSAKANFLPPVEEMFKFQKTGEGLKIELPVPVEQKQLIFGVRPCDAKALSIVDMSFKDAYQDPYYLSKRNNTVLIGIGCTNPYGSCFCTSLGIGPAETKDVDLLFTDIGDKFLIEQTSETGMELIKATSGLEEATEADEAKATEVKEKSSAEVTRSVDTNNIQERLLACFEDKDYWENVSGKCVSCGICTLLCPTCYCFDINDELVKKEGTRYRSCDSCAFSIYTKMPMENPREEKWRRVRQKVCHKYEFYPMNYDIIACTGCGRCIRMCPVNWDITQTLESLPTGA